LGEFSPIGRLFIVAKFISISEEAAMIGLLIFADKKCIEFHKKVGLHFGQYFQKSHLVTLVPIPSCHQSPL
jgi:hypothetical protein